MNTFDKVKTCFHPFTIEGVKPRDGQKDQNPMANKENKKAVPSMS